MDTKFLTEAREKASKWENFGLLEGLKDPYLRSTTTILLENQQLANKQLFSESATDTSDIAHFKRISIPLVRRIYPQLIANKIVSVQPLLGPVGLIYYLRFRYSSNKGTIRGADNNGGFPGDDENSLMQLSSGDANLSVYYTSSFIDSESTSVDDGADTTSTYSPLEHTPITAGSLIGTLFSDGAPIQTFRVSEGGTFTFTNIGTPASERATAGSIDLETGEMTLTWNTAPGVDNYAVVSYDYNMECQPDLPEINLAVENEDVQAKPRKLKAMWSFESQQDLRSQFNLDAEKELTTVLAQEINLEIDREILNDLRLNAGTVSTWDLGTALGDTIKEKYESLYIKCAEVGNVIHRKTLRGGANWMVTSPEVASIFETATAGYAPDGEESFNKTLGVQYVGTVKGKWQLYKDPLFPSNQILMGYKGESYMDSGYFYLPYVPLTQTPVVYGPDDLCPRKGIMTRYGKKMLRDGSKFYARISVANFLV